MLRFALASLITKNYDYTIRPVTLANLPSEGTAREAPKCATEYEQALMYMRSDPQSPQFNIGYVLEEIGLVHCFKTRTCVQNELYRFLRTIYLSRFTLEGLLSINRMGVPGTVMSVREFNDLYHELNLVSDSFRADRYQVYSWYLNLLQPNFGKRVDELGLVRVETIKKPSRLLTLSKAFVHEMIDSELLYIQSVKQGDQPRKRRTRPTDDPHLDESLKFLMDEDWSSIDPPVLHNTVHIPVGRLPRPTSPEPFIMPTARSAIELLLRHIERSIIERATMKGGPINPLMRHLMDRLFIPAQEFQKMFMMLNREDSENWNEFWLNFSPAHLNWFIEHVGPLRGMDINMSDYFQVMIVKSGDTNQTMITVSATRIGVWINTFRSLIL